mgnify:CR=1 FL=1
MTLDKNIDDFMIKKIWISLIRFGFRLLYYEMAWTYDVVSWVVSLGEWSAWQRAALPYLGGRRVLEIGHGPGHMLIDLQEAGYTVVGVDLSPTMGRMARKNLRKKGVPSKLVRSKVQDLPFAAGSFETILSTFPTDYIVDPATVAALWRVLEENGRIVIIPEGHLIGYGVVHKLIDLLFRLTGQGGGASLRDDAFWQNPELWDVFRQPFEEAGFTFRNEYQRLAKSGVTILIAEKLM